MPGAPIATTATRPSVTGAAKAFSEPASLASERCRLTAYASTEYCWCVSGSKRLLTARPQSTDRSCGR